MYRAKALRQQHIALLKRHQLPPHEAPLQSFVWALRDALLQSEGRGSPPQSFVGAAPEGGSGSKLLSSREPPGCATPIRALAIVAVCLVVVMAEQAAVLAAKSVPSGSTAARSNGAAVDTLVFPADRSLGRLVKLKEYRHGYVNEFLFESHHFAEARGLVKVPAKTQLKLVPNYAAAQDLSPILHVNSSDLIGIDCQHLDDFDDKPLKIVSQLSNLLVLRLDDTDVTNAGLKTLASLTQLKQLEISRTLITGDGLAPLSGMTSIENLIIGYNRLTDAGFANLEPLKNLQSLSACASGIGDGALVHIGKMTGLRRLLLTDNQKISDEGMAYLVALPVLRELNVGGTGVTAGAVQSFKKMKGLKVLTINFDKVTPRDLARLRAALPGCYIKPPGTGNVPVEILGPLH